jgi:hypothetical protein
MDEKTANLQLWLLKLGHAFTFIGLSINIRLAKVTFLGRNSDCGKCNPYY